MFQPNGPKVYTSLPHITHHVLRRIKIETIEKSYVFHLGQARHSCQSPNPKNDGDAIAELKCDWSREHRLVVIGWLFDLLHQRVTLSPKCVEKSLHGLMLVNDFLPMSIKTVQRLASWGVRYGAICTPSPLFSTTSSAEGRTSTARSR
jgi:hypothetical protein